MEMEFRKDDYLKLGYVFLVLITIFFLILYLVQSKCIKF